MSATMHTIAAPHAAAARRVDLRDTFARVLQRVVPGYLTTYEAGHEPDLFHVDACDAAEELVEELALLGWEIRRAGA